MRERPASPRCRRWACRRTRIDIARGSAGLPVRSGHVSDNAFDPALGPVGRRIDAVEGDFERAVCESLYKSPSQRRLRVWVMVLLGLKHSLRGLLFSWPLYLLGVAALVLPGLGGTLLGLFLLPGMVVSYLILRRGIAEDYRRFVHRVLLKPGAMRHILWPNC